MKDPSQLINIGRGQRNWRYFSAVAFALIAAGIAVFLVATGANRLWRLVVYLPLTFGASAFFEAKDKTCVLLANRGECSLDQQFIMSKSVRGDKIDDESLVSQLRQKARRVTLKAQVVAIAVTVLFVLLPV